MKIGSVKQIVKEELSRTGEKLPAWIDPLLQTLNTFIVNTVQALSQRLTFEDNFLCTKKTIKLTHGVESEVNPSSNLKPTGVILLSCSGLVVDMFGWRQLSNGNIGVTAHYLTGTEATCVLIIFLG